MKELIENIKKCTVCSHELKLGARPVISVHPNSKIIVIGQAPGIAVHNTGIPWNDKSGENLRDWLGIDEETFYNKEKIGIIPMGFCYPGKGKTGDLPPRKECAPLWHDPLFEQMQHIELTLLIGMYAQNYYLKSKKKRTLTETVRNYKEYLPNYFVLPHPSPRNNIWQAKNSWFKSEVIPDLKRIVKELLADK